jgi:hypothetical protein
MLSMTQSTESKEKKEIWGKTVPTQAGTFTSTPLPWIEPPSFTDTCLAPSGELIPFLWASPPVLGTCLTVGI